jgi:hypothetical protein
VNVWDFERLRVNSRRPRLFNTQHNTLFRNAREINNTALDLRVLTEVSERLAKSYVQENLFF